MDVRAILPHVHVPTLVLVREAAKTPKSGVDVDGVAEGRWIAAQLPNASLVVASGRDYLPWVGDQDALVDEIATFVTGNRPVREPERVLLTILFTDLVSSTERVAEVGDLRWRELLEEHNDVVRRVLARYSGREVDRAGDGFLATLMAPRALFDPHLRSSRSWRPCSSTCAPASTPARSRSSAKELAASPSTSALESPRRGPRARFSSRAR